MKIIGNKFSKIGTNPHKYIENYRLYFLNIGKLEFLKIEKENYSINHNGVEVISFNSDATFRQNIDCWVGLGLFIQKDNKLLKVFDNMPESNFYQYIRGIILVQSNSEKINIYRDTIIIKLMNYIGLETIKKYGLSCRSKAIEKRDIDEETGHFEKELIKNEVLAKLLKAIWESKYE
jgi:hypothetical protein